MRAALAAAGLAVALVACDSGPKLQDCRVRCSASGKCPEGTVCSPLDDMCRLPDAKGLCTCNLGDERGCDAGTNCGSAVQQCLANHSWGACRAVPNSDPEVCDGRDNDCDGRIDATAPKTLTTGATRFAAAGVTGGSVVAWTVGTATGFDLAVRLFDDAFAPLTIEWSVGSAAPGVTVDTVGAGTNAWMVWQVGTAASAAGVVLSSSGGWTPAPLPGLPRPEATGPMFIAGSPNGLVAAWPVDQVIRVGRWPLNGGPPTTNDFSIPAGPVAAYANLLISSSGTSVGWEVLLTNGGTARGVLDVQVGASRSTSNPSYRRILDTPSAVRAFWQTVSSSGADAQLVGREDVFGGPIVLFHSVPDDATAIAGTWAENSANGPVVVWLENGVLRFGAPGPGGGLLRTRDVDIDGDLPLLLTIANGGGKPFTSVFYRSNSTTQDLRVVQACTP